MQTKDVRVKSILQTFVFDQRSIKPIMLFVELDKVEDSHSWTHLRDSRRLGIVAIQNTERVKVRKHS